ncbi:MAG: ABC transporter ATP-binding protein [Bauldia sp.]
MSVSGTEKPAEPRRWLRRGKAGAAIAARVALEGVEHAYDGVPSVRGVDLVIEPGEIICLLGQSGCGKTTLLRVIAGLERPIAGRVLLNDREVAGPNAFWPPEKRGVGLMFQDYALFPQMTILENVMFGLRALSRSEGEREARRLLERVGLERYASEYPHALSGGEQQRVALARAIAPRPSVLLMDEPFSGLDKRLRENVRDETLAVLRETKVTTILVTHDPEEAMQVADRIALMRRGRIAQIGPAEDLYDHPADLAAARVFSSINEVEAIVERGEARTALGRIVAANMPSGPAIAAIRPQGILIGTSGEGVPGRVTARHFLGEVDLVEVAVEGLEQPVRARVRGQRLRPGDEVGVRVDPADVLLFAKIGD